MSRSPDPDDPDATVATPLSPGEERRLDALAQRAASAELAASKRRRPGDGKGRGREKVVWWRALFSPPPPAEDVLREYFDDSARSREVLRLELENIPRETERLPELVDTVTPDLRAEAARLLGRAWGPFTLAELEPLLSDPAGGVRGAALEMLEVGIADVPKVRNILESDLSPAARAGAVRALTRAPEDDQISALALALADPDPLVRETAADLLPTEWSNAAGTLFLEAADEDHEGVRRAAQRRIAVAPFWVLWIALQRSTRRKEFYTVVDEEAPGRLAAIALAWGSSPERGDRTLAVELAARERTPECIALTIDAIRDDDPEVRRVAVRNVAGRLDAMSWLVRAVLSDPDVSVRLDAARALAATDHDHALLGFARLLEDPEPRLRRIAVETLVSRRSRGLARHVARTLTEASSEAAGEVLRRMGPDGEEALATTILGGGEGAHVAAGLLRRMGGPPPRVFEDLRSVDADTRLRAVEALGAVGGPAAVEALRTVVDDGWPRVRERAKHHLTRLSGELDAEGRRRLDAPPDADDED